ncbi:complement C1q tumor necrosis factor-related protein 3-like [Saccostrea echinata]|uniref:complement C1q tumor necrosis factor-related protein 3-like n=1 Tax=Saccostrea echinata TaxID=191078 RepID=UPI002A825A1B|nr:complement C1q tumor necrosis factor-related protein 3-like [Saccostrea echinata]
MTFLESKVKSVGPSLNSPTHHISFMATAASNMKIIRGTLIFGNVLTNKGGAYNNNTGIFTAPVSGSYFFMVTIGLQAPTPANNKDYLRIHIIKNSRVAGYLFIGTEGLWLKRSENTLLELSKGDKVYVNLSDPATGFPYIAGGNHLSHFSGFLIN